MSTHSGRNIELGPVVESPKPEDSKSRIDTFFDCAERIIKRSKRLFPDAKVAIFDFGLLVVLICEVVRFVYHLLSG